MMVRKVNPFDFWIEFYMTDGQKSCIIWKIEEPLFIPEPKVIPPFLLTLRATWKS
jgi:hypothetical protein